MNLPPELRASADQLSASIRDFFTYEGVDLNNEQVQEAIVITASAFARVIEEPFYARWALLVAIEEMAASLAEPRSL
jgi:hypothetical protein